MYWSDLEDIGEALMEAHPGVDPLTVRFTDLLGWVRELPDFEDDIHTSNEKKLEAVQMAWYELWQDENT
jgi:FeS assembly protein IscX